MERFVVKSAKQTERLGERIAATLAGGEVILLSGELGAGKTVFCKGLGRGLGVTGEIVSPTFTILNEHVGRLAFNHIDAYRLSGEDEAEGAGITEFICKPDAVCAVEWWENIAGLFDNMPVIKITINKIDANSREITVERK